MSTKINPELDKIDYDDDLLNLGPLPPGDEPEVKASEEKKENEGQVNSKPAENAGSGGPEIAPVESQDERDKRSVFVKNVHYTASK